MMHCFHPAAAAHRNVARRQMERLRAALNWELTPVIAGEGPRIPHAAGVDLLL